MHVDLAFFDGDDLLERATLLVTALPQINRCELFTVRHQLGPNAADIVLTDFSSRIKLRRITFDMPIHESADWESIDCAGYTMAFRCRPEQPSA